MGAYRTFCHNTILGKDPLASTQWLIPSLPKDLLHTGSLPVWLALADRAIIWYGTEDETDRARSTDS